MEEKRPIVHVAFFKDEKLVKLEDEVRAFLHHKQTKEDPPAQILDVKFTVCDDIKYAMIMYKQ
ncbi:MAG: hypothetical protein GXO22_06885 [Aquificae bacterium]|nr:hypothetical protein [Aquificota bacterium]